MEEWRELLSTAAFMPHGHCYLWNPALLWTQVLSNGLIGVAYVSISATLAYLVYRLRGQIPFQAMYLAFGAFIVLCGFTHFMDVYVIWEPAYWADGVARILTAGVSVATAVLLPRLVPDALALARGVGVAQERGVALETAVEQWKQQYEQAREIEQLKSQFFANVSHELRTPLTLILGPAEHLLQSDSLSADQRRDLEVIRHSAQSLRTQVDDLLDAARLDAAGLRLEYARADVAERVRACARGFERLAEEREIAYSVSVPEAIWAEIDPKRFDQVVVNLLANAFKFTPDGGSIRCAIESIHAKGTGSGRFALSVADSGSGVRPSERETIFERFRQLDGTATRSAGGAGLGLSIARDLVRLHGGEISVLEAPEGGALFRVELPAVSPGGAAVRARPEKDDSDAAPPQSLARVSAVGARVPSGFSETDSLEDDSAKPLVMVVEDHPEMLEFAARGLSGLFRVARAGSGEEALALLGRARPEAIVTDLMMPRIGGEELISRLQADEGLRDIPVLLLSARADDSLRVRLLRSGASDYVVKPFAVPELEARVANLVRARRAHAELERARAEAEARSEEFEEFAYALAHDLRAPLRAIDGFGQLLEEDAEGLDQEARSHLSRLRAASQRSGELVEELSALMRLHQACPKRSLVDLSALAREIALRLQAAEPEREVEIEIEEGLHTSGDPALVDRLLRNLLGNAWKFTRGRAPARIALTVCEREGRRVFCLRDNGVGFDMAQAPRLFAIFQRLHAEEFEGMGIGLASCHCIVRRHGGRIWGEGEVGVGAAFYFTLGTASDDAGPPDAQQAAELG